MARDKYSNLLDSFESYDKKQCCEYDSSGLCNKHVMIVNDDSRVISKGSIKLSDDLRVVIYDRHRFIIQATGVLITLILQRY